MSKGFVVKITAVVAALGIILSGVQAFQQEALAAPVQQISASVSNYAYPANVQNALANFNKVRISAGLTPVELDPFLTKAAQNHAAYISANNDISHSEVPGNKGFTGLKLRDRLIAAGAGDTFNYTDLNEGIDYWKKSALEAMNNLIDAPYHRIAIVHPQLTQIGVGISGDAFVFTYALGGKSSDISIYPYPNQTGVPVSFNGLEEPNPLAGTGISTSGYVVTISAPNSVSVSGSIVNSKDVSIPVINKKKEYSATNSYSDWLIIPKKDLSPGETYTVTAAGKTWSFTTAGKYTGGVTPPVNNSSKPSAGSIKYNANNIGIKINGEYVKVDPTAHSVNSNTFIPLRGVFEAMGATVNWNQAAKQVTITKDETVVKLTVGNKIAIINGREKRMGTASFSKDGSTFVPLRFASEALGAKVTWDQVNWTAVITLTK